MWRVGKHMIRGDLAAARLFRSGPAFHSSSFTDANSDNSDVKPRGQMVARRQIQGMYLHSPHATTGLSLRRTRISRRIQAQPTEEPRQLCSTSNRACIFRLPAFCLISRTSPSMPRRPVRDPVSCNNNTFRVPVDSRTSNNDGRRGTQF